jgi:hypothetical protein
MFKAATIVGATSLTLGLMALAIPAEATCTSTFTGTGAPRLFDSTSCSGSFRDIVTQQTNLSNIGFNNVTGSIQVPANSNNISGWTNTGFTGTKWTIASMSGFARWLSFQNDPVLNNATSSVTVFP